jgi:hypothetical protein
MENELNIPTLARSAIASSNENVCEFSKDVVRLEEWLGSLVANKQAVQSVVVLPETGASTKAYVKRKYAKKPVLRKKDIRNKNVKTISAEKRKPTKQTSRMLKLLKHTITQYHRLKRRCRSLLTENNRTEHHDGEKLCESMMQE